MRNVLPTLIGGFAIAIIFAIVFGLYLLPKIVFITIILLIAVAAFVWVANLLGLFIMLWFYRP